MKSLQRAMIPDDENGEVLLRMLDEGDDLTVAREIDFYLVFATREAAENFASVAAQQPDLVVSLPQEDEEGIWQVACSRHMVPRHAAITALEQELTRLAEPFGGYPDGWGCMQAGDAEGEAGEDDGQA